MQDQEFYSRHSKEKETCLLLKGTKYNTTTIIRTGFVTGKKTHFDVMTSLRNLTYPVARDIKKHLFCWYDLSLQPPA
jgi:hypothetical protein